MMVAKSALRWTNRVLRRRRSTVTRSDVIWAYRTFLGRQPENEGVVQHHCGAPDLRALCESFADSAEFKLKSAAAGGKWREPVPIVAPSLSIDTCAESNYLSLGRLQRVGRQPQIPLGSVRFGDFKRLSPIGRNWGGERGTPVDRYYIERFLAQNAGDIRGRVLELADSGYTRRFGGDRVEQSDVLSIKSTNRNATIVGDLLQQDTLPKAKFDCIIFTQALQYIFEPPVAISRLGHALKLHGVLLATAPGVTKMENRYWPWYWAFNGAAVRRLLEDNFGQDAVTVETHGNILAATAFLHGLAVEELDACDLNVDDQDYPIIVAGRAIKRREL